MSASVTGRNAQRFRARASEAAQRMPWLVDVYRAARNPGWELDLWRDVGATRRASDFVRQLPVPEAGAPVALVALYRDDVFDAKIGMILATALRLRGMRPVVSVPSRRQRRVARYASALGIRDVISQEDIALSAADLEERDDLVRQLLDGDLDFPAIAAWRFRDRQIGTHVLSTLIRLTFDGSPDLSGAENRELLASVLGDVITNSLRSERILRDHAPAVVLVEEANYSVNGPLVDVATARGVDVIHTIVTWRDDALMSKRITAGTRRVDAKSVAPTTLDELATTPWTPDDDAELDDDFDRRYRGTWALGAQFQPGTEPRTAEEIVSELGLDPQRPTAVVFAHVLWDASLFYGVDLFENYSDWLVRSVGAAVENDRVNWVVKAHPSNVFRSAHGDVDGECSEIVLLRDAFPSLPPHVKVLRPETRISTLSLYRFADFGVTVRGTPGMEMACFAKPVFTAGTGTYAGLGFTYDSDSTDQYLARLAAIDTYGKLPAEMTERARRYAHALFLQRPWVPRSFGLSFHFAERGWSPLDRNVGWRVDGIDALHHAGDLDRWASWVIDSGAPDYVEPRARLADAASRP